MSTRHLEPPPPDAPFAVTNVIGGGVPNVPGYGAVTDTQAVLWVADEGGHRHFWVQYHASDVVTTRGNPFRARRARLGFEAGWIVSIAWGSCTYSSNHDWPPVHAFTETPSVVELAVLGREGHIVCPDGEPLGYLGPAGVLAVIATVATWPSGEPLELTAPVPDTSAPG
jgi:hypothetical protein